MAVAKSLDELAQRFADPDEALIAERDRLRTALHWAVHHLARVGGYMTPEDCQRFLAACELVVEPVESPVVAAWLASEERL
jgi:hypothetical protein